MLDPNHFSRLLNNPRSTIEEDLEQLENILEEFPYLQSARALQLKIYNDKNSKRYNNALRKTAAYTIDRDVLFQFITSDLFTESNNTKEEVTSNIDQKPLIKENKKEDSYDKSLQGETISEEEKIAEELELDKPIIFNKNDAHSFSEWMKLTKRQPIERGENIKEEDSELPRTDKIITLVDAFLKNNPRPKKNQNFLVSDKDSPSLISPAPQALMTETLARVYLQQKNYKKAIQAYKILILKNPEKSGYFADKIRAIEKLTNKK